MEFRGYNEGDIMDALLIINQSIPKLNESVFSVIRSLVEHSRNPINIGDSVSIRGKTENYEVKCIHKAFPLFGDLSQDAVFRDTGTYCKEDAIKTLLKTTFRDYQEIDNYTLVEVLWFAKDGVE